MSMNKASSLSSSYVVLEPERKARTDTMSESYDSQVTDVDDQLLFNKCLTDELHIQISSRSSNSRASPCKASEVVSVLLHVFVLLRVVSSSSAVFQSSPFMTP